MTTPSDQAIRELALALNSGTTDERQKHVKRALGLLGMADGEAPQDGARAARDWPLDAEPQSGRCANCGEIFSGNTRRSYCRVCRPEKPAPTDYEPSHAGCPACYPRAEWHKDVTCRCICHAPHDYEPSEAQVEAALPHLARAFREALLSDESVEAVAPTMGDVCYPGKGWENQPSIDREYYRKDTRKVLTAAADHVFGPAEQEKK